MTAAIIPLNRKVANGDGNSITIIPRNKAVAVEVGTDTAYIQIGFTEPNDLRALAGHFAAVADELQRNQQGGQ